MLPTSTAGPSTTLALIKPDAVAAGAVAAIEAMIQAHHFGILARMETQLSTLQATHLFSSSQGTKDFDALVNFMSSGPIVALALTRDDGINAWLELLGTEDSTAAPAGSVRALFGTDVIRNAAHGSASAAAAQRELKLFFPKTFPRELTVAVLAPSAGSSGAGSTAVASAARVLQKIASMHEFLCVARAEVTLTPAQAARYCQTQPAASMAELQSGPLTALLLEKAWATEDLCALLPATVGASTAGASVGGASTMSTAAARELGAALGTAVRVLSSIGPSAARREASLFFGESALQTSTTAFALITPDAMSRADEMLATTESAGFTLVASRVLTLSEEQVSALHGGVTLAAGVCAALTAAPSLALAVSRPMAASALGGLMGPADPAAAAADAPLSLRALYGGGDPTSISCLGSVTDANATRDVATFFPSLFETSTTLGLLTPDAAPHVEAILAEVDRAGLVVTSRVDTPISHDRAVEFLRLLGPNCPPPISSFPPPVDPPSGRGPPSPPAGSFEAALAHLTSGPCVVLSLAGVGAIERWAALLGPLDPLIAKVRCPTCLRARFGVDATRAVGYGSLTAAGAPAELKYFFPHAAIPPVPPALSKEYAHDSLNPTLTRGLIALCRARPADPTSWLAHWLLANNPIAPMA